MDFFSRVQEGLYKSDDTRSQSRVLPVTGPFPFEIAAKPVRTVHLQTGPWRLSGDDFPFKGLCRNEDYKSTDYSMNGMDWGIWSDPGELT